MSKSPAKHKPPPAPSALDRRAAMRAQSGVGSRKAELAAAALDYPIAKGRQALKGVSVYMHPLAKEVLDKIAREHKRSRQDLCLEALNLLFRHYGEKPIA